MTSIVVFSARPRPSPFSARLDKARKDGPAEVDVAGRPIFCCFLCPAWRLAPGESRGAAFLIEHDVATHSKPAFAFGTTWPERVPGPENYCYRAPGRAGRLKADDGALLYASPRPRYDQRGWQANGTNRLEKRREACEEVFSEKPPVR